MSDDELPMFANDEVATVVRPEPYAVVLVHFADVEDRRAFEKLVGQRIPPGAEPTITYPKRDVSDGWRT